MKVAIVDGYSTGRLIPAMLRERGVECIHVQSRESTHPYYSRTFQPEDYTIDLGYSDNAKAIDTLRDLGVDRVVAGTESGVALAARLGAAVGGPHNDPDLADASVDKALMYEVARSAGLAVPEGGTFRTVNEVLDWAARTDIPEMVAKPTDSAGTDHVRFCSDRVSLEAACREILAVENVWGDQNETVTVQERLWGQEAAVNTVSQAGRHVIAEAWSGYKQVGAHNAPIYDAERPVRPASAQWKAMAEYVSALLDALGVTDSPAHTELMVTEGRGVVLLETGARLSGATIPAVVRKHLGMSQADLFIESIVDNVFLGGYDSQTWFGGAELRYVNLINRHSGAVVEGYADAFRKLGTFVAMSAPLGMGSSLPPTSSLIDAPGYVYLCSDDPVALDADYQAIRALEQQGLYTRELKSSKN